MPNAITHPFQKIIGCDGKVRHATHNAAAAHVRSMQGTGRLKAGQGRRLNVYRCGVCGGYHVGKKRRGTR